MLLHFFWNLFWCQSGPAGAKKKGFRYSGPVRYDFVFRRMPEAWQSKGKEESPSLVLKNEENHEG